MEQRIGRGGGGGMVRQREGMSRAGEPGSGPWASVCRDGAGPASRGTGGEGSLGLGLGVVRRR